MKGISYSANLANKLFDVGVEAAQCELTRVMREYGAPLSECDEAMKRLSQLMGDAAEKLLAEEMRSMREARDA